MAFGDIIQVADNSVGNVPGATSLTVAISAAVAGNLLICGHFTGAANSTAPSGFSEAVALTDSGNADQGAIYYKIAEGGETSVIPGSATADEHAAIVIEIEGPWAASPLDQTASNGPATRNTTSSGTTSTTTQADEIAVALMTGRSQFALFTAWTNAFVARGGIASSFKSCAVATKLLTATGAQETTADHLDSIVTMGGIATFKKAATGGGATYDKVGGAVVGSIGAGADAVDFSELGGVAAIAIGGGADATACAELGGAVALAVSSGADAMDWNEGGGAFAGASAGGAKLREIQKVGGSLSG